MVFANISFLCLSILVGFIYEAYIYEYQLVSLQKTYKISVLIKSYKNNYGAGPGQWGRSYPSVCFLTLISRDQVAVKSPPCLQFPHIIEWQM